MTSTKKTDIIMQNKVFLWTAIATVLILFMAMLIFSKWDWKFSDFVIAGTLIFGICSMFTFVARKINKKYRFGIGIVFMIALLYFYAELAVGVFTNFGS